MLCHAAARSPTALLAALLALLALATATCYRPDGSAVDDSAYRPLDEGAEFSVCCRAGATRGADHADDDDSDDEGGGGGDARASLGLCGAPGTHSLWRASCSDPTWASPACLSLCADGDYATADEVEITACDDGSYCCGADSSECCARGDGVFVVDNEIIPPPPPPPLRKRELDPPLPPPFSSSSSLAPRSPRISKRALSREAVTGLAVAGAFGVVGALTVAVYAAAKWKRPGAADSSGGGVGGGWASAAALPSGALPSHHAVSLPPAAAFAPHRAPAPLYYHTTPLWGSTFGRVELDAGAARPQELAGCPAGAELEGARLGGRRHGGGGGGGGW